MTARTPLIPLDDALTELLAQARPLAGVDTVSTFDADGRVLAQAAISPLQVPQQDNSAMDGYALRCADVAAAGVELRVSQRIAAGDSGQPLLPGTAARIFTGAPVPAGADAVVMQEDCEALDDGQRVRINHLPSPGQAIRRAGEDITLGAQVLAAGTRLTPAELGLAASIGLAQLQVALRPRVALFSTGDELVMPGEVAPKLAVAGTAELIGYWLSADDFITNEQAAQVVASGAGPYVNPLQFTGGAVHAPQRGAPHHRFVVPGQQNAPVRLGVFARKALELVFIVLKIQVHTGAEDVLAEDGDHRIGVGGKACSAYRDHGG